MAQLSGTHSTYDAAGNREDLSDLISNIDPTATPFQANIGSRSASNTYFEWQTQSLAAASTTTQIEGDNVGNTTDAVTATSRIGNYTNIVRRTFTVSGTQEAMDSAGRASESGYQAMLKAKEVKRDTEKILCDNRAAVAGDDTTARVTGGLTAWLKTNVDSSNTNSVDPVWTSAPTGARSDGVQRAFTETILKNVVKKVWDNGGEPSILMVGSFNKQAVSAFAGIAAQRFMAPDGPTTIIGAADIYQSDFGKLSVVPNRFQRGRDGFVIDPNRAAVAKLRDYSVTDLAVTGDYAARKMLLHEFGLQLDNEAAHGIAADLSTS